MKIEQSSFLPATDKVKSARIRFADTPGTLTLEDGWFRDRATLRVMAPPSQAGALLKDMRHLAEGAGLPFVEEKVQVKRSHFQGARGDSAPTADGQEYYIASYQVPVKNAQDHLRGLVAEHAASIQSIETPLP